jgi:hypothetical protein
VVSIQVIFLYPDLGIARMWCTISQLPTAFKKALNIFLVTYARVKAAKIFSQLDDE